MQRASSTSLGLRSIAPFGQSTIGSAGRFEMEAFEQGPRAGIGIGIELRVWMPVAR